MIFLYTFLGFLFIEAASSSCVMQGVCGTDASLPCAISNSTGLVESSAKVREFCGITDDSVCCTAKQVELIENGDFASAKTYFGG